MVEMEEGLPFTWIGAPAPRASLDRPRHRPRRWGYALLRFAVLCAMGSWFLVLIGGAALLVSLLVEVLH